MPNSTNGDHLGPVAPKRFYFQRRTERIDWRRLAALDVDRIVREVDVAALQDTLENIAFCDVQTDADAGLCDPNFAKLFRLAQLDIEYLLHSQEYLTESRVAAQRERDALQSELDAMRSAMTDRDAQLRRLSKECRARKKTIESYQRIISMGGAQGAGGRGGGGGGFHSCPLCPKMFLSPQFVVSHLDRRHPGHNVAVDALLANATAFSSSSATAAVAAMTQQEMQGQLEGFERRMRSEMEDKVAEERARLKRREEELVELSRLERLRHEQEMRDLKATFTRELETQQRAAEQQQVQHQQQQRSHLGVLQDDEETEALRRQVRQLTDRIDDTQTRLTNKYETELASANRRFEERLNEIQRSINEHERERAFEMRLATREAATHQRESAPVRRTVHSTSSAAVADQDRVERFVATDDDHEDYDSVYGNGGRDEVKRLRQEESHVASRSASVAAARDRGTQQQRQQHPPPRKIKQPSKRPNVVQSSSSVLASASRSHNNTSAANRATQVPTMSDAQLRESVLADPRLRPTPLHEKPYLQSRYSFSHTDFDQQRDAVADILDANLAHRGLDNASATTIMTTADFDHKMAQLRAEQAQRASLTPNFIALRDILDAEISSIAVQHAPTLPALPTTQPQSVPTAQPRPPSPPPSLAQAPSVPSFSGILSSPPVSRAALSSPPPTKAGPKATTTTTIADPSAPASPLSQRPPKAARSTVTPQSPTTTTVRPVSPALADDSDDEPDSDDEAFRRHQHQHPSASTSAAPVATHTRSTQPKGPVFSPSGKRLPPGAVSVFPMGAPLVPVSRAPASPPPASNLSSTSDHSDFDDDVVGGTPSGRLSSTPARSRVPRTEPESPGMDPVPHEGASPHDPHARMQAFDAADDDDDDDDEGDDEDDEMEVSERAANETVVIERDANGMPRIAADVHLALTDDDDLSLSDQQVSAVSAPSDDQNSYSQPHPASTTISRPKTSTGRPGSSRSTLSQLARDEQVEDSLKDLLHSGVSDSTAGTLRKPKVVNLDDDDDDWDDDFGDVQVLRL